MISKTSLGMIAAAMFGATLFAAPVSCLAEEPAAAAASHEAPIPPRQDWSFAGFFGKYDQAQLQRGFQVFREVCSNCHSADHLAFRNLAEPGGPEFSVEQVKALAAQYKIKDGPNDAGDMFERPGRPSDYWPSAFANANQARTANSGALPPDMSVLAKARGIKRGFPWFIFEALPGFAYQEQGVDYIVALMTGYEDDAPKGVTLDAGQNFNHYFPGNKLMMPKPLSDGQVAYTDGAPQTLQQYSKDVAAFLMWTAEPKLDVRKKTGFRVLIVLAILAGLFYATKKRIWADVQH